MIVLNEKITEEGNGEKALQNPEGSLLRCRVAQIVIPCPVLYPNTTNFEKKETKLLFSASTLQTNSNDTSKDDSNDKSQS